MRQSPTLTNVWVRSVRDAMLIFNAVANEVVPKVDRRLDENERSLIQSGNVYVWEERGAHIDSTGLSMERWTDGLHWGPSRARDEFLYYQQIVDDGTGQSSKRRRTVRNTPLTTAPVAGASTAGRSVPLLTKQTFSANVALPREQHLGLIRKWHMTAYFASDHVDELRSVDTVAGVGDATLPEGVFTSARTSTRSVSARRNSMTTRTVLPPLHPSTSGSSSDDKQPPPPPQSIPPTPSSESVSQSLLEPSTSGLGPIPPLPSTASAPTHFPSSAAWDPYAPAARGSDTPLSCSSRPYTYTPAPSGSYDSLAASGSSVTRGRRPGPVSHPPASSPVNVLPLPVANTPYGDLVTANNPVIVANRNRRIAADPQNLANVAIAAERPFVKLAPLAYLEGLGNQRRRRDPIDEAALRSFQPRRKPEETVVPPSEGVEAQRSQHIESIVPSFRRARPRRWARSGS